MADSQGKPDEDNQGNAPIGADSPSRQHSRQALIGLLKAGAVSGKGGMSGQEKLAAPGGGGQKVKGAQPDQGKQPDQGEAPRPPAPAEVERWPDGSLLEKDAGGRVLRVRDSKGEERHFGWDAQGRLIEVTLPFGSWRTADGKVWTNSQGKSRAGMRAVDHEGTYWEEDEIWRKIYRRDGTQVEVHKPGENVTVLFEGGSSLVQQSDSGNVRRVRHGDGSEHRYLVTSDGSLRPLYQKYARPVSIDFQTPEGKRKVRNISEVEFEWQESTGIVKMRYRSSDGPVYVIERTRYGELKSFTESKPV